ncbi:MAG: replicative DNA helicase, partial [Candidatus Fimimonas sp.]
LKGKPSAVDDFAKNAVKSVFLAFQKTQGAVDMPRNKEEQNLAYTTMPNSVEAEQNVLCCIMRNVEVQLDIIAQLAPDDFYQPNHAIIFDAMQEISRGYHSVGDNNVADTVNFTTVVDHLRRSGNLSKVGDIDYILRLNDVLPGTANYDEYVAIVRRASTMRKLINICGEITKKAYSTASAEEAISFAEESIFNLSQRGSNGGLINLAESASNALVKISKRYANPDSFRGVETGFRQFDRLTNGLHGGELIVLAARPGVGKSALSMNIVENVAKSDKTVAVFSLEMSNEQIIERMLSSMSSVPLEFIKNGQLPHGQADLNKLSDAHNVICSKMRLYGNDFASIKPSEITSQCRRLKAQKGLDLVVIDYIQLMNSDLSGHKNASRENEVANITRSLKLMAKELNVPVIALSQLKRDAEIRNIKGEKGSNEPVLSDLRESGAIEQDADIVMFIHKDTNGEGGATQYSLIVAKHRNGETATIPLHWFGKTVRFVDEDFLASHGLQPQSEAEQTSEQSQTFEADLSAPVDYVPQEEGESDGEFVIPHDDNE